MADEDSNDYFSPFPKSTSDKEIIQRSKGILDDFKNEELSIYDINLLVEQLMYRLEDNTLSFDDLLKIIASFPEDIRDLMADPLENLLFHPCFSIEENLNSFLDLFSSNEQVQLRSKKNKPSNNTLSSTTTESIKQHVEVILDNLSNNELIMYEAMLITEDLTHGLEDHTLSFDDLIKMVASIRNDIRDMIAEPWEAILFHPHFSNWENLISFLELFSSAAKVELLSKIDNQGDTRLHKFISANQLAQLLFSLSEADRARVLNLKNTHGLTVLKATTEPLAPAFFQAVSPKESTELPTNSVINDTTLGLLRDKASYPYNPHRHVKIWLSNNPEVFMNIENQLRLIRMRKACPQDDIHLAFDSRLLSENAHNKLLKFCSTYLIKPIDLKNIKNEVSEGLEQALCEIYEDEITHLHAGGNLAAASDVLRWLERIYKLGTYSDFDVHVATKHLPPSVFVHQDILINLGCFIAPDGERITNLCNDVIAILSSSSKVHEIQRNIIDSCSPQAAPPPILAKLMQKLEQEGDKYQDELDKLKSTYSEKSPRQFRGNIDMLMNHLKGLQAVLLTNSLDVSEQLILNELSILLADPAALKKKLYLNSVIDSTGPGPILQALPHKEQWPYHTETVPRSISFYPEIFQGFRSLQAVFLNMTEEDRKSRCNDLSWFDSGILKREELEQTLNRNAQKIQRFFSEKKSRRSEGEATDKSQEQLPSKNPRCT